MLKPKLHLPEGLIIRPYQEIAYQNWCKNSRQGIFAMATGTGKTKTSLNCVYRDHLESWTNNLDNTYQLLILVPTQSLLDQWSSELTQWGFTNVYRVSGDYPWRRELQELLTDVRFGLPSDFAIVATYKSLTHPDFLNILQELPRDTFVIADEAHNLGQKQIQLNLDKLIFSKRIGLSATPKRAYDPDGTHLIERFFNDVEPYIFNLNMDQAIEDGHLCKYEYYPRLVELTPEELNTYLEISKRIALLIKDAQNDPHKSQILEKLLLRRKRIINKAYNKLLVLSNIIEEIRQSNGLKYCFTYAPPGDLENPNDMQNDNVRLIREMQKVINDVAPEIRTHAYLGETTNRTEILKGFAEGSIDVLLAINCLDEGVDIPRAAIGIFTSSSGNPRQYIQRRGRILRKHPDKSRAYIYDMIVIPTVFREKENNASFQIERGLVRSELMRVGYFAKLSENFYDAKEALAETCRYYNLDLDTIIKELEQ